MDWTKTCLTTTCPTCSRTSCLEQAGRRLRIEHHPDIRDAILIPQPLCPGGEQEQVLVSVAKLDRARQNHAVTSDPRMEGYYEGWREAAKDLDPRPGPRLGDYGPVRASEVEVLP